MCVCRITIQTNHRSYWILQKSICNIQYDHLSHSKKHWSPSHIQRALHADPRSVQYMGVDHGHRNVLVPPEFLDCPDVIVCLQQVSSKGMAKGMDAHRLIYTAQGDFRIRVRTEPSFTIIAANTVLSIITYRDQGRPLGSR